MVNVFFIIKYYPIPLFVFSVCHPLSPDALRNPGLVDFVLRVSGRSRIAPPPPHGKLGAAAGWRDAFQMLFARVAYLLAGVSVSPERRPFLLGPLPPPTLHPIALQWSEQA